VLGRFELGCSGDWRLEGEEELFEAVNCGEVGSREMGWEFGGPEILRVWCAEKTRKMNCYVMHVLDW
jgi:hypothetical protein